MWSLRDKTPNNKFKSLNKNVVIYYIFHFMDNFNAIFTQSLEFGSRFRTFGNYLWHRPPQNIMEVFSMWRMLRCARVFIVITANLVKCWLHEDTCCQRNGYMKEIRRLWDKQYLQIEFILLSSKFLVSPLYALSQLLCQKFSLFSPTEFTPNCYW